MPPPDPLRLSGVLPLAEAGGGVGGGQPSGHQCPAGARCPQVSDVGAAVQQGSALCTPLSFGSCFPGLCAQLLSADWSTGQVVCLPTHALVAPTKPCPACRSRLPLGHLPRAVARHLAPLLKSQQVVVEAVVQEEPLGDKAPLLAELQISLQQPGGPGPSPGAAARVAAALGRAAAAAATQLQQQPQAMGERLHHNFLTVLDTVQHHDGHLLAQEETGFIAAYKVPAGLGAEQQGSRRRTQPASRVPAPAWPDPSLLRLSRCVLLTGPGAARPVPLPAPVPAQGPAVRPGLAGLQRGARRRGGSRPAGGGRPGGHLDRGIRHQGWHLQAWRQQQQRQRRRQQQRGGSQRRNGELG